MYSVNVYYLNGEKWKMFYHSLTNAECMLNEKIIKDPSITGFVYDEKNKKRIMTYGICLDE